MEKKKSSLLIPVYCFGVLLLLATMLIIPALRKVFESATTNYPFLMGFVKFSLLALAGELFAKRITSKQWLLPSYVLARFLIWGFLGVWITFIMKVFSNGVAMLMEKDVLFGGNSRFLRALFTSIAMNTAFAPTFMALHKCTDRLLDAKKRHEDCGIGNIISSINWSGFVKFTLLITIPVFWIPAHTVTFLLPEAYQVALAASLSVALGIILSIKGGAKKTVE